MSIEKKSKQRQEIQAQKRTCGQCGSGVLRVRHELERFTYGSGKHAKDLSAVVPVYTCQNCGYEFLGPGAEDAMHEAVCKHLQVMSPKEVKELRKKHGLSRSEFAQLTRLGAATIARWERGALVQNPACDQYLYLLRWKENVSRLRNRKWTDSRISCDPSRACDSPSLAPSGKPSPRTVDDPAYRRLQQDWRLANFCQNEQMVRRAYRELAYMEAEGPEYQMAEQSGMADEDLFLLLEDQSDDDPRAHIIQRILSERQVA